MRTQILPGWVWGIMLAGGVVAAGVAQDKPASAPTSVSPEKTAAAVTAPAGLAELGSPGEKSPAPEVQLSPWSLEVQKLAQAQVDEGVMLAYVTNSAGIFNLSADDIIQLKSLGVPGQVMNAMIEHDRELLSGARPLLAAAAPSAMVAAPSPAIQESQLVANNESWVDEALVVEDAYYAPEQPESIGPVRAPYPVKLNDPIVILKLPSLAVPYW